MSSGRRSAPTMAASGTDDSAIASNGQATEQDSLLQSQNTEKWKAPRGFIWIEIAVFSNVFLSGFDSTITASTYAVISSEFDAANIASWLTTSYLITSTAFQPLYGRFSDIFGRRACFFTCAVMFALGCLGCAVARDIITLNLMRALTGVGGAGLMTMATIINSDMIPLRERGMYQAAQNGLLGFGSICGASLGGPIADTIGWRWCFLLQVPVSIFAIVVGYLVVKNVEHPAGANVAKFADIWSKVDLLGSLLLVLGLSSQLVGLSLGGNELPWSHWLVITTLIASIVLLGIFLYIEGTTSRIPIIPLRMAKGSLAVSAQTANVFVGLAAYAFLFMIPLFFQVVLLDSASKAGARLILPSLATPAGGLIAGIVMSRYGHLAFLVRLGCALMVIGNGLMVLLKFNDSSWKYFIFIVPANLGQGIVYPGILFTVLAAFGHEDHAVSASTVYLIRSLGWVWGVSLTSAIVQNTLSRRLPEALSGVPNKWELIDRIKHSTDALRHLPSDIALPARLVYYDGIRLAFIASTACAGVALVASIFAKGKGLQRSG